MAGYMQRVYIFTHLEFIQGRGWPAKCNVYTFLRAHSLLRVRVVRLHATYIHFNAHIVYSGGGDCPATCNIYTFLRAHKFTQDVGRVSVYMQHIYIFTRT